MSYQDVPKEKRTEYNNYVSHPLQSYEWGEFREKTGIKVIRKIAKESNKVADGFQMTIHNIPHTPFTIGYLPKGFLPTKPLIEELQKIGRENKCIFIQLEPNVEKSAQSQAKLSNIPSLVPSARPLFTQYTFILDIEKSEEELLKNMSSKTRYNIRLAEKKGVTIHEKESKNAFREYLRLTEETTTRQRFYAHTKTYHTDMWETLGEKNSGPLDNNTLTAHLLTGEYEGKTLVAWILFIFHDTLYYPYGASSSANREVMASNLIMWEAIRFGKKLGLKKFDMWGAMGESPDTKNPWYGFHRFKSGYNPRHVEFVGSYDLVINPLAYQLYKLADKARWLYLRIKK